MAVDEEEEDVRMLGLVEELVSREKSPKKRP